MACVCEWCVTSVLGIETERQEGAKRRQIFFFNFGDVKCAAGKFHRSMKRIIMHEPLTQWKWVCVPDTWLVVVSLLLIYSHLGCMTAEGDPMETQLWCLIVVYNTLHAAYVILMCWLEWQEKSRVCCSNKKSKQSLLALKYQTAFVTIFIDP